MVETVYPKRGLWSRRGSAVRIDEGTDGQCRAVALNLEADTVIGWRADRATLIGELRKRGWVTSRRRCCYVRRGNLGPAFDPPRRMLTWVTKRQILERIGGRQIRTDAALTDALASVHRIADRLASPLARVVESLTQADRSELLGELQ